MTCKTCFGHPGCLAQTDGKNDSVDAQARELILPFPEIVLMPRRVGVFGGICNCPVGLITDTGSSRMRYIRRGSKVRQSPETSIRFSSG